MLVVPRFEPGGGPQRYSSNGSRLWQIATPGRLRGLVYPRWGPSWKKHPDPTTRKKGTSSVKNSRDIIILGFLLVSVAVAVKAGLIHCLCEAIPRRDCQAEGKRRLAENTTNTAVVYIRRLTRHWLRSLSWLQCQPLCLHIAFTHRLAHETSIAFPNLSAFIQNSRHHRTLSETQRNGSSVGFEPRQALISQTKTNQAHHGHTIRILTGTSLPAPGSRSKTDGEDPRQPDYRLPVMVKVVLTPPLDEAR